MGRAYRALDYCICCAGRVLLPVIDLGRQPLANNFHDCSDPLPVFPLALNLCPSCFHAQLALAVDPDLIFRHYPYVSGTSKTARDYCDWFARYVDESIPARRTKRVLDIACNDGTQLRAFAAKGWQTWGVDPAENLAPLSRATGARILCGYWTRQTARELGIAFDAIVAQNVFAHVRDPLAFLEACSLVMDNDSKLFIQTSQADMFYRGELDAIYHEHLSFFSTRSIRTLARRAGLVLEEVFITPIHGKSYVFVLGYGEEKDTVVRRIAEEERQGRYEIEYYQRFTRRASRIVENLKAELKNLSRSFQVVGFGAAAKSNTLLNFGQIDLTYIVDNNPLKQGLYTPGMNIPIHPPERLVQESRRLAILILAWNFFDEIGEEIRALRPDYNDLLITYFPKVSVRSSAITPPPAGRSSRATGGYLS